MVKTFRRVVVASAVGALIASTVPGAFAASPGSVTLLVTAKHGASVQQVVGRNGGAAGRVISRLGVGAVTVPAGQASAYLKKYGADSEVAGVELQRSRRVASAATDPSYGDQWALPKIGWDSVHGVVTPASTATLAVLDTGVSFSADVTQVPGWSAFGGQPTDDPNGHGTALASIAAATTDNDRGIAGVAYDAVTVMPVQVLGADGTGTDADVIAGITWAADNGADVILMGFSDPGYSAALQSAVDYAWSKGAVLVAATGNDGSSTPTYPAGDAHVVGVSATDSSDALASSSNYGEGAFLAAPGVGIATGSGSITGTSASAAVVAGAAALLKANDGASNAVVVGRLARNADVAGTVAETGNGRVNLARAISDTSTSPVDPVGTNGAATGGPFVGPYVIAAARAELQGQISPVQVPAAWTTSNLTGWSELASIPMRLHFDTARTNATFVIPFDHTNNSLTTPGIESLTGFTASGGLSILSGPTLSSPAGTAIWTVSITVTAPVGSDLLFSARLAAGSHNFPGASLSVGDTSDTGALKIVKPSATGNTPDLALSKSAPGSAVSGGVVTYTLSYQNKSSAISAATGVQLQDTLPAGATYVAGSCTGCTLNGSQLLWNLGNLAIGATGSRTFQATLVGSNGTTITNTASILSADNDATPGDNLAGANTLISGNPSISGTVYNDTDGSGNFTAGELGIQGVIVTRSGTSSGTTTTDANGNYSFSNLTAGGTYNVDYTMPSGFTATSPKPVNGITVLAGQNLTQNFFAWVAPSGNISGTVYNDLNGNGILDAGDTGLSGVTVSRDGTGTTTAVTNGSGQYSFTGLGAASYSITYTLPAGYADTSLTNPRTVVLGSGGTSTGQNFFLRRTTSTSLATTGTPSTYGSSVTFTATVTSLSPSNPSGIGTVTFSDGATPLCSAVALTLNTASCVSSGLTAGTHNVTATYSGTTLSPGFSGSTSNTIAQVVNTKPLSVTASPQSKTYGDALSLGTSAFTTSGLVGTDSVTSVTLSSTGTAATATVAGSPYAIVPSAAVGSGLSNYAISYVSGALTVNPKALSITANNRVKAYGEEVTFDGTEFSALGLVNGDTATLATLTSSGTAATATVAGSPYAIVPSAATGSGLANYAISYVNGQLTVGKKLLTVTATSFSREYGAANGTLGYTFSGFRTGEDETTAGIGGAPTCSTTATAASSIGLYAISCVLGTLTAANYSFAFADGTLTVTPKALDVTAGDRNKTYGDTLALGTTGFTTSGLVNGDNVGAVTLTSTGTAATATVAGSPYVIVPSAATGTGLSNYTINYVNGNLTVDPKALTVTASNGVKTYGDDLTLGTSAFGTSGLVNSDSVSAVTLTSTGAAATATVAGSSYAIVPSAATGTGLSNYTITYANGALTVNAKALSITANNRVKTYGEEATFDGTEFSPLGLVNTDTAISVTLTSAGAAADASAAGSPYAIVPSAATGSGLANYSISYVNGQLTVGKKLLTVTATSFSREYGAANGTLGYTFSGFRTGEDESTASITGTPACSTTATTTSPVGPYAITCVVDDLTSPDYDFAFVDGTLTVTKKALGITASDRTKVYGATLTLGTVAFSSAGLVNGDTVTGVTLASAGAAPAATFVSPGPTYPVTASNALGSGLGNYTITYHAGTLTLTPKPLTVTANSTAKTYGASVTFAGTEFGTSGLVDGDVVTSATLASAGAAATATVAGSPYAITVVDAVGTGLGNYSISYVDGALTVNAKALTVTASNRTKTYGDEPVLGTTAFTTSGLENSDTVDSVTLTSTGAAATAPVSGSPYSIVPSAAVGSGLANYAITYANGTLTVNQKALTVTADNRLKTYGDALTLGTTAFGTNGLVNGDTVTSVTLTSAGAAATALVAGSPYEITPSLAVGTGLANYAITYVDGALTVLLRDLDVTATSTSKTYGQTVTFAGSEFTTVLGQLVNGDTVTSVTLTSAGAAATATVAGSPYAIVASDALGSGLANYSIAYHEGTLTVGQKALSVTANSTSKTYGATVTFAGTEFSTSGLTNSDAVSSATISSTGAAAGAPVSGSPYTVVISDAVGTGLDNYTISYTNGTLTVTAKALTITADNRGKTYGDLVTFAGTEFTSDGLTNGDSVTSVTLASGGAAAAASFTSPGPTYPIVASGALGSGLANYLITYVDGTLTLSQKALGITASDRTKVYGDVLTLGTLAFSSVGLVNGDTVTGVTLASAGAAAGATYVAPGPTYALTASNALGSALGNYAITYHPGTLTVTPKPLTVTADSPSKTYGDVVLFDGTEFTTSALANSDSVDAVTLSSDGAAATATVVGSPYPISVSDAVGNGLGNYTISYVAGSLTVNPKTLDITANNRVKTYGQAVTFDGTEFSSIGLVNGDTLTAVALTSSGAAAGAAVSGSPYAIVPSGPLTGTGLSNYTPAFHNGQLTVNQKLLTITATSFSREYGSGNGTLAFTYSGFTNGEDESSSDLIGAPECTTTATTTSPVGGYAIACVVDTLSSDNYDFAFVDGTLSITKKDATVAATNRNKEYGSLATFAGTEFTDAGFLFSDGPSSVTLTSAGAPVTAAVGGYSIVPSAAVGTGLGNYAITYQNGTLTVDPKALTVTANNRSKTYGDALALGTSAFTTSGLVNTDSVTAVTLASSGAAASATVAGSPYAVVPSAAVGTGLTNYTISYVNGTLTVNAATLTVSASSLSRQYGMADPAPVPNLTGYVLGQNATSANVTGTASCSGLGTAVNVGVYPSYYTCTPGTLGAPNYVFVAGSTGALTVTQRLTTTALGVVTSPTQFSDQVTLTATVTPSVLGSYPAGSVLFAIPGEAAIPAVAVNTSTGVASVTIAVQGQITPYTAASELLHPTATFTPTDATNISGSSATGDLVETLEDAAIEYTGSSFFVASSTSSTTTSGLLTAVIKETDSLLGNNLPGTTLRFTATPTGGGSVLTCDALVAATGPGIGAGSCTIPNLNVPNTYQVNISLVVNAANGYYDAPVETISVTTTTPGTGFTAGGGWILEPNLGTKSNFGFTAKYLKKGIQGNSIYIYRKVLAAPQVINGTAVPAGSYNWILKANVMDQMQTTCTTTTPKICGASFTGKVNVTAVNRDTGASYSLGGGRAFQVDVTDKGEPGSSSSPTPDTYAIRVTDGTGTYYQLGSTASQVNLNGGNIQVRP